MAASDRDIQDFFLLSGTNDAVSVDDLKDMKKYVTESKGLDSPADADDIVDALYQHLAEQTFSMKRNEFVPTRLGNQP